MKTDSTIHKRRSIRLKGYDYSQPGGYFITIVAQERKCLFGEIRDDEMNMSEVGRIADGCWRAIPEHFPNVELGTFVVMPNHVHGIIILHERADADAFAKRGTIYRAPTGIDHVRIVGESATTEIDHASIDIENSITSERFQKPVSGSIPTIIRTYKAAVTRDFAKRLGLGIKKTIWKRNYFEHIIRDDKEHNLVNLYIDSNVHNWTMDEENPVHAEARIC